MKQMGALAHVGAQGEMLVNLCEKDSCSYSHCILCRLSDDTNIWVQGGRNEAQGKQQGKSGSKKVASVLGLCERLSLRSSSGLQTVQLAVPAQVLPQASIFLLCQVQIRIESALNQ